eukprot:CAMPEP_0174894738 /NCGR_PEP_ID=MMETSP0167-20121228/9300_1 /TAXON_ID=38298 /ORGANISM="Rhodella maculata, Strain CCMP736" /LENGTH=73 /DNA_ID=CAMNT_0016133897 /DNA_START=56 /DNA_END=277 /DNA_ORIENTATION=+
MTKPDHTHQHKPHTDSGGGDHHQPLSGIRGEPKKGGAGGKGTWGALDDTEAAPAAIDKKDPNYDPTEEEAAKK